MYHYLFDMKFHDPRNRELVVEVEKVCEELSSNLEITTSTEKACAYIREINECLTLLENISAPNEYNGVNSAQTPHFNRSQHSQWNQHAGWGQGRTNSWNSYAGWEQARAGRNPEQATFKANLSWELPNLLDKLKAIDVKDTERLEEWYALLNEKISACLTPGKQNAFKQFLDRIPFSAFQKELLNRAAIGYCDELAVKERVFVDHIEKVALYIYDQADEQK